MNRRHTRIVIMALVLMSLKQWIKKLRLTRIVIMALVLMSLKRSIMNLRHTRIIVKVGISINELVINNRYLIDGLSEPEFHGDLVYKFKTLMGRNDFSFQFRKIITRYRRIGYNLNVMRQSACLVFNQIMVDNYAAFFNCTPVSRASHSMMTLT